MAIDPFCCISSRQINLPHLDMVLKYIFKTAFIAFTHWIKLRKFARVEESQSKQTNYLLRVQLPIRIQGFVFKMLCCVNSCFTLMLPSYTRSVGKTPLDENHIIDLVSMSTYCHVLFRHAFPFPDILSEISSQHHGFHSAVQQKENIKKKRKSGLLCRNLKNPFW